MKKKKINLVSILSYSTKQVKRFSNQGGNREMYNLSYYLAGLIEGDGHFNTPNQLKTPSGRARVAALEVVFTLKDRPSAELLKSLFGGNIYDHSPARSARGGWLVQDKKSLLNIINLINGKLRTPKINYFNKMIDFFLMLKEIIKLPLDTSPLNSNGWLAGLLDADGHFRGLLQTLKHT